VPFGQDVTLQVQTLVYDPKPDPKPDPNPHPDPNPNPNPNPGELRVKAIHAGPLIEAWVSDAQGSPLSALCTLSVGGVITGTHQTIALKGGAVLPAVFVIGSAKGQARVTTTLADGRAGSAELILR
jgi:hypothetical protein